MAIKRTAGWLIAAALVAAPAPVLADVKAGVDAWTAGDYAQAVTDWRAPAAKGDADAQFNLAQAYRLGRGVDKNARQAEVYYAKAAAQGHLKAADNLGLLMFEDGRRQEALPYLRDAAARGDPRAEYILGIAHFNGDLIQKDWPRAYALMTLANSAGLPQAAPALKQMDGYIPLEQRQQAQTLAASMKADADARRTAAFAGADLDGAGAGEVTEPPVAPPPQMAAAPAVAPATTPQPIPATGVAPSVAAAQAAIAEAARVTGTQSPADAGAQFATRSPPPAASARPARPAIATTAPVAPPPPARSEPSAPASAAGPWKVQLGAFSVSGNADKLWRQLSGRGELAGRQKLVERSGQLTKLLAGGYPSREAAENACAALKRAGHGCLVTH